MKNVLGLDLGSNSVGWALVKTEDNGNPIGSIKMGSRIIPMSQDILGCLLYTSPSPRDRG